MRCIERLQQYIDTLSEWSGKVAMWSIPIMAVLVTYNVFMRYVLLKPTIWSYELNYMLCGAMFVLGLAYVHKRDAHVRIDVISTRFSEKTRLVIEVVFAAVILVPVMFGISRSYWAEFLSAVRTGQTMTGSTWYPPSWPFIGSVAIGFSFFFLAGLSKLVRDVRRLLSAGGHQ